MNRIIKARAQTWTKIAMLIFLSTAVVASSGCIGALTQLMYVIKGQMIPANYEGLEDKKVAVVCVSDATAYGPDALTFTICKGVSLKLGQSVKDIQVIAPYKVEEWLDENGWSGTEFEQIGRDLGADVVLGIEISSYSIRDGKTMYKGRSDITATVFNIEKDGQVDYVYGPEHYVFPESGRPAIQTTPRQFETVYLTKLTQQISRQFFAHERAETFAEDASLMNY